MSARTIPVFFYGLFMDTELLAAKGAAAREARRATVSGYALRIGARATLVPEPDSRVFGFVYRLTHEELDHLYAEPSFSAYRAEPVLTIFDDGTAAPALSFHLPAAPAAHERNETYAASLRALAERLQLPAAYIATIA